MTQIKDLIKPEDEIKCRICGATIDCNWMKEEYRKKVDGRCGPCSSSKKRRV